MFNTTSNQGLSHGAIAGIVVGGLGGLIGLVLGFSIIVLRYRKSGRVPVEASSCPDRENATSEHSRGRLPLNTDEPDDSPGSRLGKV
jgi:hypothetical protein